jgi:hypothetical protein
MTSVQGQNTYHNCDILNSGKNKKIRRKYWMVICFSTDYTGILIYDWCDEETSKIESPVYTDSWLIAILYEHFEVFHLIFAVQNNCWDLSSWSLTNDHPIFLGPILLHKDAGCDKHHFFLSHISARLSSTINNVDVILPPGIHIGSDDEEALTKAIDSVSKGCSFTIPCSTSMSAGVECGLQLVSIFMMLCIDSALLFVQVFPELPWFLKFSQLWL